jgi:hypothetical protein
VVSFFDPDFSPFDGSVTADIYSGRETLQFQSSSKKGTLLIPQLAIQDFFIIQFSSGDRIYHYSIRNTGIIGIR